MVMPLKPQWTNARSEPATVPRMPAVPQPPPRRRAFHCLLDHRGAKRPSSRKRPVREALVNHRAQMRQEGFPHSLRLFYGEMCRVDDRQGRAGDPLREFRGVGQRCGHIA